MTYTVKPNGKNWSIYNGDKLIDTLTLEKDANKKRDIIEALNLSWSKTNAEKQAAKK